MSQMGFCIRFLQDGVGVGRQVGWGGKSEPENGGPHGQYGGQDSDKGDRDAAEEV